MDKDRDSETGQDNYTIRAQKYDPQLFLQNAKNFQLDKVPCAMESITQGILGGVTVGIQAFQHQMLSNSNTVEYISSALSWSVGGFAMSALVSLEVCRRTRESKQQKLAEIQQAMRDYQSDKEKHLPYLQDRGISSE
eukprot:gene2639-5541_t